jgi:SOS-response transcriptional repressor LexA
MAGTPSAEDAFFITEYLSLPAHWFGEGGTLCAFEAEAATMDPIVPSGSIVIIDTSDTNLDALTDAMVAARDWRSLKLFWLQKH